MQAAGAAPQTYIVAQNPLVLAHLLRENQARSLDPQAYTTPASVFNTVSVDFAESLPEDETIVEKIINPKPDEIIDIPLQTAPIPAASLHKLDPIVPEQTDETLTVVVGASCDNLCQNTASPEVPPEENTEPYASRVRSLERNTRVSLSTAERAPVRMGSLERNARGSLSHRGSPVPIAPFTRQHSVPASPPPRSRREQDVGQFSVQGALNAQLAASVVNKMRQQPDPPLVEEIYDFGGENVKSCAAIAAQKAMSKPFRPAVMSASHPTSYGVPVGVVQGVPYSQSPVKPNKIGQFVRSSSPVYPGAVPPMYLPQYSTHVQVAQPMYRPQATAQTASQGTVAFGSPGVSQAAFGTPGVSQAAFGTPGVSQAAFGTPGMSQAAFGAPGVSQAAFGTPSVSQAAFAAPSAGQAFAQRPQFVSASSVDAQSLYASRQECSPVVQPVPQAVQVIATRFVVFCLKKLVFEKRYTIGTTCIL